MFEKHAKNKASKESAVVLFSGGQDSTTCLYYALKRFKKVHALGLHYGQRHEIELDQAKKIAKNLGVEYTVLNLQNIELWDSSALVGTSEDIEIAPDKEMPNSFVPGRNLLFLNYAAIYAFQKQCSSLVIGVCQTDFSGYPDCRNNFIRSAQNAISLALGQHIEVLAPLMWMSKAETVQFMDRLGGVETLADSHTCYYGNRPACGTCPSCKLRKAGFKEAGIADPLLYSTP